MLESAMGSMAIGPSARIPDEFFSGHSIRKVERNIRMASSIPGAQDQNKTFETQRDGAATKTRIKTLKRRGSRGSRGFFWVVTLAKPFGRPESRPKS